MTHLITLIAPPAFPLEQAWIDALITQLAGQQITITSTDWLAPAHAVDIVCEGADAEQLAAFLPSFLEDKPIDFAVQLPEKRRKKLLISDMDSTIINQECIDELADYIGKKPIIAAITERAMNGELEFKEALRERVALLAGLPESTLEQAYQERISLMSGAKTLVSTMRHYGAYCVLVSGGFTFFTSRIRAATGFHCDEANNLDIKNGVLTGKVQEPILDKMAKLASLHFHRQQRHLAKEETLAVGDGANDLPMLQAAGLGVAYHAKPTVRAQVNIAINHNDLTALLYLQGYKKEQFCS